MSVITADDPDTDAFTTQGAPHVALEPCEAPFPPGCLVNLQQEMRPAGKIETEAHLLVRQPCRQAACQVTREQVWCGEGQTQNTDKNNDPDLPGRKVTHGR